MIRAVGFNGIAAIIWGVASPKKMQGKLNDGVQSNGMQVPSKRIADAATYIAALGNAKHYCIGLTILENYSKREYENDCIQTQTLYSNHLTPCIYF